jgi:isopropylmalate/homocitrate/citramalate synthase
MFSNILRNPPLRLFDVTLRDGLQSIPKIYSLAEKMDLGLDIVANKNPKAIET